MKNHEVRNSSIAILSMACRFPGACVDPASYWSLLEEGRSGIVESPNLEWDLSGFGLDEQEEKTVKTGGFLGDDYRLFDADFFRMSPKEARLLDPQHRILLEVVWEAIENAGLAPSALRGSQTGVFMGAASHDYVDLLLQGRRWEEVDAYFVSGNVSSTAVGRLSFLLDLRGPCIAVDTACSSSLVAIEGAVEALRAGRCDLALAGGVQRILSPVNSVAFLRAGMLAADGKCKTFDASADGYVRGEGCGVVVLKRLADAVRDGDPIAAVIRGVASNQDGASSGLTVPNDRAQEEVIRAALADAGVEARDVSYVETHGTGTNLGDPIEMQAIGRVYGEGREEGDPLFLGAVKSNIGHTEVAAGVAGLLKVILSMQHKQIPRNLHFHVCNPKLHLEKIPALVPIQTMEWKRARRLAGVSSFGFSGTNAGMVQNQVTLFIQFTRKRALK